MDWHGSGAERARRLAQLAEALDNARMLLAQLAEVPPAKKEIAEMVARVAAASAELESLRRGGNWGVERAVGPTRIKLSRERPENGS